MPALANQPYRFQVDGDSITMTLEANGQSKSQTRSVQKAREFILNKYNWNGMVKLMKFVYQAHEDTYPVPGDITGTQKDIEIVLPERGIIYILSLQLRKAMENTPLSSSNLDLILNKADNQPGPGFCRDIIGVDILQFLNEGFNDELTDPESGNELVLPQSDSSPQQFYDFYKRLVLLRNGLWSEKENVVNIVGLRRVMDDASTTSYNDTLAVCWKGADGSKNCELNIITTEPGDRQSKRQLFPQTVTLLAGYHKLRQPGGRTRGALKEGSDRAVESDLRNGKKGFNDKIPTWTPGDTTMNFHQGGNTFAYPGLKEMANTWLERYGISNELKVGNPTAEFELLGLLKLNLVISEIYLILSKYGEDGTRPPYQNMENMLKFPPIENLGINGNTITVRQSGFPDKVIDIDNARRRSVRVWFDGRRAEGTKKKFYPIIQKVSNYTSEQIQSWREFTEQQVLDIVQPEHISNIVNLQIQHTPNISLGVDGIAGNEFYEMIIGVRPTKQQAADDKKRLDELFAELLQLPLKNKEELVSKFKNSMQINTFKNRNSVLDNVTHLETKDIKIIEQAIKVGAWSDGCQVFYDTEVFYNFWTKLLKRAIEAGQFHWYYTLVDATNFKTTDLI